MNKALLLLCLIGIVFINGTARAGIDAYDFHGNAALEQRFRTMVEELRCPKCQNANIAGSNAPLAKDIKDRVFKMMVEEGKTDEQILAWAEQRYGTFITYRPPLTTTTLLLWFGPFTAFIGAIVIFVFRFRNKRNQQRLPLSTSTGLSAQEQVEIENVLQQYRHSAENNNASEK